MEKTKCFKKWRNILRSPRDDWDETTLDELFNKKRIALSIKELNSEVLEFRPIYGEWVRSIIEIRHRQIVDFIFKTGIMLKNAVEQDYTLESNWAYNPNFEEVGESIAESLVRQNINLKDISQIVIYNDDYKYIPGEDDNKNHIDIEIIDMTKNETKLKK